MKSVTESLKLTKIMFAITYASVCIVKSVKSVTTSQHGSAVDSNFRLYPAPMSVFQFCPKCNEVIFGGKHEGRSINKLQNGITVLIS